jgi:hypothetical protein
VEGMQQKEDSSPDRRGARVVAALRLGREGSAASPKAEAQRWRWRGWSGRAMAGQMDIEQEEARGWWQFSEESGTWIAVADDAWR